MKTKKIFFWACDYGASTGEGKLGRLYIQEQRKKFNIRYSKITLPKFKIFNYKYLSPFIGILIAWIYFFRNKEYIYLNESETSSEYKGDNEALNQIGAKCREILLLISEEYKYKEISDRLGIPMGTVMNRLLRCRKQLHQDLYGMSEYNEI